MTGQKGATTPQLDPDSLELAPGTEHQNLEGWAPVLGSDAEVLDALEKAFDYRGDVTLTTKDGTKIEGYIFDRVSGSTLANSFVRVLPKDSNQREKIAYADIAALAFTGRDPAAGKSWEAWVRKYWEKKAAGERGFGLQPESLE